MSSLVPPHGGFLKPLLVEDKQQRSELFKEAESLRKILLSSKEVSDVIMLATGAFSPLEGFMCKKDYESVVRNMRLASGVLWPIPVTLAVPKETADSIKGGQKVLLIDPEGTKPLQ